MALYRLSLGINLSGSQTVVSQYKRSLGIYGGFNKPPTCDGCGKIFTTHRKRWSTLWTRPVLVCAECRELVNATFRQARVAHIRALLKLELEAANVHGTAVRESTPRHSCVIDLSATPTP